MSSRSKKLLNKSAPFIGWGLLLIGVLVSIFLPRFSGEIRSRASQEKERTEFPIAVYQRGFSPPYEEFKETGINIFLLDSIYNFDEQKEAIFKVLDEAEKYELKVILNVSVPMQHPVLFPQFEEFLKKVKDHPALYGYYLMDEPELYEFVTAENFRKLNSTIKKYDTKHPTIVVFSNDFDRATKYFGVTDIAGFDIYTYLHNANDQISMETEYSKKLNLFVEMHAKLEDNKTKSYFIVPQAFADSSRREPTLQEYEEFIKMHQEKSRLFQGFFFYQWTPDSGATALGNSENLRKSVKALSKKFKNTIATYPVIFGAQEKTPVVVSPSPSAKSSGGEGDKKNEKSDEKGAQKSSPTPRPSPLSSSLPASTVPVASLSVRTASPFPRRPSPLPVASTVPFFEADFGDLGNVTEAVSSPSPSETFTPEPIIVEEKTPLRAFFDRVSSWLQRLF